MSDRKNEWFVKTVPHSNPDSAACGVKMFRIEDYCGVICEISPRSHFPVHVKASHAHLIAASPLMFQTLEKVAGTLTIWEAEQGLSETESALLRDVLAAIAAAKGETV